MTWQTCYLAGKMTGEADGGFKAFALAAGVLRERGKTVISPVEMNEAEGRMDVAEPGDPQRGKFLERDIATILDTGTDAVVVLPGWEDSEGARIEVAVARAIEKPVLSFPELTEVPGPALRHPASASFHRVLRELAELHDRKQLDYGRDEDPFANVRGSTEWGVADWVGAMIRATDKVRRLQAFARRGTLANEGVIDAFDDLAVYAVIGRVLFEQSADVEPASE